MTAPSAVGVLREVVEAARIYFDRYCVDEAEDTFEYGDFGYNTGCTQTQSDDAKRLRTALTQADAALASLEAAEGDEPARWFASGPAGSFFTDDSTLAETLIFRAGFDRDEWTVTDLAAAASDGEGE